MTAAYKSKIRSLFVNLKDKNNPGLRESVVAGDLAVTRFVKMTSQEMASEERKAADNKIRQENLFKTLGAEEVQAETDAFQCGRCKQVRINLPFCHALGSQSVQRKCRYRQAQTRSADEPMTVSPDVFPLYSATDDTSQTFVTYVLLDVIITQCTDSASLHIVVQCAIIGEPRSSSRIQRECSLS